jgi:hypothetical protein
MQNKKLAMVMVGHVEGVADVRLKADPEKKHQFRWVDPKQSEDIDMFQLDHYRFVTKEEWDKTELLWNWDAEGRLVGPGHLMARDGQFYLDEVKEREWAAGVVDDSEDERALAEAERLGISVTDLEGNRVKRRPGRPRKNAA